MNPQANIDKLVEDYVDWADSLSIKYFNAHSLTCDEADIVQMGRIGLWRAAQKYDPERGLFSTYAPCWILGKIRQYLSVTLGAPDRNKAPFRNRIKENEYVLFWKGYDSDIRFSCNGTEGRVSDKDLVSKVLAGLAPRQDKILRAYYFEGYTLQEIGDKMGLTRERIRQLRNKALRDAYEGIICENSIESR